jgi:hypothetical protein
MWRLRGNGILAIMALAILRAGDRLLVVLLADAGSLNQSPPCLMPSIKRFCAVPLNATAL